MPRHTMNPAYGRMLDGGEEADREHAGEIRRLEIEPAGGRKFRVASEYEGGRHTSEELDAEGVRSKVAELVGEGAEPKGKLGELAALIPDDATKGKVKVSFKREGDEEDEE